jgi:hypothetical protein
MNYRLAEVLAEEDASSAKTKTIDITLRDVISRIIIRMRCVNAATRATLLAHPAAMVSKIELVDGSNVLFSLNGYEAQALNYYDQLVTPDSEINDSENSEVFNTFCIDFGRYLYDTGLAFDPKKFTNPQLKITHNYRAVVADAVSGSLEVFAHIFDEKEVAPTGFLMSKQIQSYDSAAGAYEYIDLPTDYPIRKLLVRAYLEGKAFDSEISELRLSEDSDKRVPFNMEMEPYLRELCGILPPIMEHWLVRAQDALTAIYGMPTYWPMIYGLGHAADDLRRDGSLLEGDKYGILAAAAQTFPSGGHMVGYIPHQVISVSFGLQNDPADWYDVTKLGSLRARLKGTTGSSAAEVSLFLQQLRRYA